MRTFSILVCLSFSSVYTYACGGSSEEAGGTGKIDDFVAAYCRTARSCCTGRPTPDPLIDCESEVDRQFELFASVRSGKTKLIEPAYSDCVKHIEAVSRTCSANAAMGCAQFFRGTVGEGGACDGAVECERGATPVGCFKLGAGAANDNAAGVCHTLARSHDGEPCAVDGGENYYGTTYTSDNESLPFAYCDTRDGLRCDFGSNTCKPLPKAGDACSSDECGRDQFCGDGVCKTSVVEGGDCDPQAQVKQCASGLICRDGRCSAPLISESEICQGDFN